MTTAEGRLAAGRLGLFTLGDARRVEMSDKPVHRRVTGGRYERLGSGVFAIVDLPWTWDRRALAALIACGPHDRLSHRAAAHHLGFDGFGECLIEVTVPRGGHPRTELAVVHTTTALNRLDVMTVGRFR